MRDLKWKILSNLKNGDIVSVLLENRGITTDIEKREFFNPRHPLKLSLKDLGIDKKEIKKVIDRIDRAKREREKVFVYGDYDADGICATAIAWEALYKYGVDALPYIPERFSEGYGINAESIEKLKIQNPDLKLIITVDNGIAANRAIEKVKNLGIDVIITDHHTEGKKRPDAYGIIHTTKTSGSGVAWIMARELGYTRGLELVAIGTVADQIPLVGVNRSFVKYGLEELNRTSRLGLLAIYEVAGISKNSIGTYEINYVIAPRINAMGRLEHGMDSLRLLCTNQKDRAFELAKKLSDVNYKRQNMVEESYEHALGKVDEEASLIIVAHESYHEGVIGLVASSLAERYHRPSIVLSKGERISKASARSIAGFNIIEAIYEFGNLLINGGGHPMAAGFTIKTEKVDEFSERIKEYAQKKLTKELLGKKMVIDMEVDFSVIDWDLVGELEKFAPFGVGNYTPLFYIRDVEVVDIKTVGYEGKHLKMLVRNKGRELEAIAFGLGDYYSDLLGDRKIDIACSLERNVWEGRESLQLKIKDIKLSSKKEKNSGKRVQKAASRG